MRVSIRSPVSCSTRCMKGGALLADKSSADAMHMANYSWQRVLTCFHL